MERTILTYNLTGEQQDLLAAALPQGYQVLHADCVTDLIVTDSVLTVINPEGVRDSLWMPLYCYCLDVQDVQDVAATAIVWLGKRAFPKALTHFYYREHYSAFLEDLEELLTKAKRIYDRAKGHTDIYSFLPRHAIEEAMEADVHATLERKYGDDSQKKDRVRKEWMRVLETENGAQLLAAVYELTRWLRRENIPYRMDGKTLYGLIPWLLDITQTDPQELSNQTFRGDEYVIYLPKYAALSVNFWLRDHWYFRRQRDPRLTLIANLNPVTMLAEHATPTAFANLQLFDFDLETGFPALDNAIQGFLPGEVILLGGRPAMGKTAFASSVTEHLTAKGKKVTFFDMATVIAEENSTLHTFTPRPFEDFSAAVGTDAPDFAIVNILSAFREYDGSEESVTVLMERIRQLAKEMQIPIVVLVSLNRDPEYRPDPTPRSSDYPHSKRLLSCADTVLSLYRPAYYDHYADRTQALCIIEKARRCEKQCIPLLWSDEKVHFTDALPK